MSEIRRLIGNLKGPTGDTGPTGPKGDAGDAATIEVGSVTTGEAGSSAAVENEGTALAAVFNFAIPRGAKGESGTSFTIKSLYGDLAALQAAHPTGSPGDAYSVGTQEDNEIYIWDVDEEKWTNIGSIQGVAGANGEGGSSAYLFIRYSASSNGADFTSVPGATTQFIGIAINSTGVAPASASGYDWTRIMLDSSLYAKLASPAFTGAPTAPTAAAGADDTQLATTAFVKSAVAQASPEVMDNIVSDIATLVFEFEIQEIMTGTVLDTVIIDTLDALTDFNLITGRYEIGEVFI